MCWLRRARERVVTVGVVVSRVRMANGARELQVRRETVGAEEVRAGKNSRVAQQRVAEPAEQRRSRCFTRSPTHFSLLLSINSYILNKQCKTRIPNSSDKLLRNGQG